MAKSTLNSKLQTTVPKEIRDLLGVAAGDILHWEVVNGEAVVTPATQSFLRLRGCIRVGAGSTVDDVRQARRRRGSG